MCCYVPLGTQAIHFISASNPPCVICNVVLRNARRAIKGQGIRPFLRAPEPAALYGRAQCILDTKDFRVASTMGEDAGGNSDAAIQSMV